MPVPHLLVATLAVLWLAPGGLADRALGALPVDLVRDPWGLGIVAVYVYKETPFLVLLLLSVMGRALASARRPRPSTAPRRGSACAGWCGRRCAPRWWWARSSWRRSCWAPSRCRWWSARTTRPRSPTYAYEATRGDLLAGEGVAAAALLVTAAAAIALAAAAVRFARTAEDA